jgi:alpha-ketoglutarate-dependent taurine dioxygenase
LDVHYYYYYPYGQVWSRLHKSYPLYSPDVIKYVKFQQWEIEDCDPPRAVKFDRLRRINDLATEMGIPNLHTLDARYRAEERWHLLFPLATEFFEGTFISRVPFSPSEEARQLLPSNDLRDTKSHQTALAYVVRVSKQIAEATLRRAAQTLIEYNEILQFDAENRAWLAEGLPPDLGDRVVSVIEMSSVETPEALKETATLLSSGLQPRTGDSIRIAVANGSDSAVLVVAADRAVADARSVALFLEDLFRIYEQLANDKPVTLRRPDASYCEYLQKWGAFDSLAPASSPVEPCPHQSSERRQGATIMVETDILRRFTPRLQKQSGLSFPEFVLGGLALSLAEAGLETPSELEIRADLRLIRPEMRFTACPLHSNCHITLSNQSGEPALATALNIRKKLHEAFIQNRPGGAASVALDLEGLTDEPWVGGDEWVPQGFVPLPAFAGDAPVKLSGFLDCGRVSFTVEYSEDQAALVERWSAALEGRTGGVWERLIEEIENSVADGCRSQAEMELPGAPRYQPRRRRGLSASDLVEFEAAVGSAKPLPLIARSSVPDLDPIAWAAANRERVDQLLLEHGAILFRGFNLATPERFRQFAASLSNELLEFSERAAPRLEVAPRVYTSTEYPPEYPIPIHHENSFAYRWPMKLFFYCQLLAKRGGNTPIANSQRFLELLDPEIRERFREKQLMYVRNYTVGVDLRWQEVFQTDDRSVVEEYCRNAGLQYEWLREDWLRTTRIAPAILKHPRMGKDVWFNHAHMFHTSNVEPSLRELFVQEFREQDLPRNTYYGDGTPIENDVSEHIRETYRKASVRFPWQEQDVLLLDNMAVAHGREAFVGDRKILVAMADWSS